MIFQSPSVSTSGPLDTLSTFLTAMIALSVATERVVQVCKPVLTKVGGWAASARFTQLVAFISGIGVTALSGMDPWNVRNFTPYQWTAWKDWAVWLTSGVLVSGGSAFWNHALDLIQAAKVQKEQAVNATLTAAGTTKIPR